MYPMTITLHDHNQLNAVMAALGFVQPIEAPKADTKPAKNKKEPAQATVANNGAIDTPESSSPAAVAAQDHAPEAASPSASGAASVTQMTATEAVEALNGHANRPADAPTYQDTADAVTKLARTKGRDAAVAVLSGFGAAKLPDVKPEQFAAVIAACEKAGA